MLQAIQDLLKARGTLSRRELALHFDMAPDALVPMLELLERKGRIRHHRLCNAGCPGCTCATADDLALYTVAGDNPLATPPALC